ncbi:MAG: hypothetical protein K5764_00020 [Prevotella sp.]|nr:hypothetical protein [Prevotella sp.]
MKKRIYYFLLTFTVAASLTACGGNREGRSLPSQEDYLREVEANEVAADTTAAAIDSMAVSANPKESVEDADDGGVISVPETPQERDYNDTESNDNAHAYEEFMKGVGE